MEFTAQDAPDPNEGWSRSVIRCRGALIVPNDRTGFRARLGVFDRNGGYCANGATWRYEKPLSVPPPRVPPASGRLSGRWLWAGILFDHFGHFVVESAARLWAAHRHRDEIDGLCYAPKLVRRGGHLHRFQTEFLAAFGIDLPVRVVTKPTLVERLLIPGQGLGLGRICRGTDEMREAVQSYFGVGIQPKGPDRLYVARVGLPVTVGGIIGEEAIACQLQREGYEIFCPERHDIPTQIARYKAARQLIIADGSAAHLFAYVANENQSVGYLLRRAGRADGPIGHIAHFAGAAPAVLSAIRREWHPTDRTRFRGVSYAEIEMADLQAQLRRAGFIGDGDPWPALDDETVAAFMARHGLARDFRPIEPGSGAT